LVAKPSPAESAAIVQPLTINLGTLLPRGTSPERLLLRMAESWCHATDGKITLKIFSDGRAGNESEMLNLLGNRRLQGALMTAIGLEEIDSGPVGLQKLPLGFASLAEIDYVTERITPLLEERLKRKGLVVLFWSDGGWIQLFSRQPVETPADLLSLRLFMWAGRPSHVELMRAAGFNPVPLETGDTIPALRNGLIDAGALPPFLALSYQIDQYAPHMLVLNSEPLIGACVIRRDTWESIPTETRERLLAIARATGREITTSARRESAAAVSAMQRRGLTVHTISPGTTAEWRAIADKFRPLTRGHIVDADIFDRVQALIAEYRTQPPAGTTP